LVFALEVRRAKSRNLEKQKLEGGDESLSPEFGPDFGISVKVWLGEQSAPGEFWLVKNNN
jgi:hypothetical protein